MAEVAAEVRIQAELAAVDRPTEQPLKVRRKENKAIKGGGVLPGSRLTFLKLHGMKAGSCRSYHTAHLTRLTYNRYCTLPFHPKLSSTTERLF